MFLNLPIFAQNGGHFIFTMETGGWGLAEKSSIYFLLNKTHSIHLAEKLHELHK